MLEGFSELLLVCFEDTAYTVTTTAELDAAIKRIEAISNGIGKNRKRCP